MRRGRSLLQWAAACGVACALVVAACSSFSESSEPEPASEAGTVGVDAAVPPLPEASSSGLAPTPGRIGCFGRTCDTEKSNDICCYGDDAGGPTCQTSCSLGEVAIHCDDKSDCAPNESCCVGFFGSAECQASCTTERLCRADSDCEVGSSCVPVPCRGIVIGACGPVGSYVKGFCDAGK